jgi:class 3 adenylate cyclase/tetratricopeptide (TPR) repeat protein
MPSHLAEKIRQASGALEGERKQVTVFFADVMGSMDLAEEVDPEDWRGVLHHFYEILTEGVHRFEGTVNQYTGDGIMAIFGAPLAYEDHATRACHAALHLRHTLGTYARELRKQKGLSFSVRIGMNSGEVVVGGIGPDLHLEYTAVGHTVGLASRMEHLAAPGCVYLTEATAEAAGPFFDLEDLGPHDIKGVREPVRVLELRGGAIGRVRFDLARARRQSLFVGRSRESAVLQEALDHTEDGRGQVVAVIGEPGVGKSRLCHEFVERVRHAQTKVIAGHGRRLGSPLQPILELLRDYFGVDELDDAYQARQKVAGGLLLLDEAFRDDLALLFDFLGIPDPDLPYPQLDPEARASRLQRVVGRLVRLQGGRAPMVVLIEDLQWLDEASQDFVAHLVQAVEGTRILCLLNHRHTFRPSWSAPHYRQVLLGPLDAQAVTELLAHRLGGDPTLDPLAGYFLERTQGNPFFVEEVVRALMSSGVLSGTDGAYRLTGRLEDLSLPPTIQAVIAERVDRLADGPKSVLQTASVIGSTFSRKVLAHVCGMASYELDAAIGNLLDEEFLVEQASEEARPDRGGRTSYELTFKHRLTQEVAYLSQLAERRRNTHAAVARAILEIYPDRLAERAGLLSSHWEEAGETMEAARWHRRAAEWTAHHDTRVALHHWQRIRELLGPYPAGGEAESLALSACLGVLNLGPRHGLSEQEAQSLFDEGRTLATHQDDKRSLARLLLVFARVRGIGGDITGASQLSLQAADIAEHVGLRGLRLAVAVNLASWSTQFGNLKRSLEIVDEALNDVPTNVRQGAEHLGYSPFIWLVMNRGRLLTYMNRLEEADEAFSRALHLAAEHGEVEILSWVHQGFVDLSVLRGDGEAAASHAARAVESAERAGTLLAIWSSYHSLGRAHVLNGQTPEAIGALERALGVMSDNRTGLHLQALVMCTLAEAHLETGDLVRAEEVATSALKRAREVGGEGSAQGVRARTLLSRARRLAGTADPRVERRELEAAMEIIERINYRSLEEPLRAELEALG